MLESRYPAHFLPGTLIWTTSPDVKTPIGMSNLVTTTLVTRKSVMSYPSCAKIVSYPSGIGLSIRRGTSINSRVGCNLAELTFLPADSNKGYSELSMYYKIHSKPDPDTFRTVTPADLVPTINRLSGRDIGSYIVKRALLYRDSAYVACNRSGDWRKNGNPGGFIVERVV